mmetsp:Transcript_33357/g.43947  ORF Transcript_33357/g.43947 Transcript_33357/m.43947 type:complete len:88 (-) Transcript_33357:3226-3489(-)
MELFVTENMHNQDKNSPEPSASFNLLTKYGFRQGIISALKSNVQVSASDSCESFLSGGRGTAALFLLRLSHPDLVSFLDGSRRRRRH